MHVGMVQSSTDAELAVILVEDFAAGTMVNPMENTESEKIEGEIWRFEITSEGE